MGTDAAKAIYKERAATAECVNAQARERGLTRLRVRGRAKVGCVLLLHALAHNLMRTLALAPSLLAPGKVRPAQPQSPHKALIKRDTVGFGANPAAGPRPCPDDRFLSPSRFSAPRDVGDGYRRRCAGPNIDFFTPSESPRMVAPSAQLPDALDGETETLVQRLSATWGLAPPEVIRRALRLAVASDVKAPDHPGGIPTR